MISVPFGTGDISFDMISTVVDDICSAYDGTDIISHLLRKYIIRLCRISYRSGDISLKTLQFRTWVLFVPLSLILVKSVMNTRTIIPTLIWYNGISKGRCFYIHFYPEIVFFPKLCNAFPFPLPSGCTFTRFPDCRNAIYCAFNSLNNWK